MLKKTLKWIDVIGAVILAVVLGGLLLAYSWLSWKPRDVTEYVPKIMAELNLGLAARGYDLQLQRVELRNEGVNAPLLLAVDGLTLKNPKGEQLVDIPQFKVTPSFWAILRGSFFPSSVEIVGADFAIFQDKAGAFYLDTKEQAAPVKLDDLFFAESTQSEEVHESSAEAFNFEHLFELGLNRINISRATVQFKSELTGFEMKLPQASAHIDSALLSQQVKGGVSAAYYNALNKPSLFQAVFHYNHQDETLQTDVNVNEFTPAQFATLGEQFAELNRLAFPLSGRIVSQITFPNQIDKLQFDLSSKTLAGLKVQGSLSGSFAEPKLDAQGTMGEFDLAFLQKHWPEGVGQDAHRWITESIKQATVEKAEFELHLTPELMKRAVLPKDAVKAVLHIKDAEIDYTKGFPLAKEAKGTVTFAGQSLHAEIDAVKMLWATGLKKTTQHPKATVTIPDLMLENINILLNIPLQAPLSDVLQFMKSTPYRVPSSLNLQREKLKGKLEGLLAMQIVDQISPIEDEVDFQLDADLHHVAYEGLGSAGVNLSALDGKIKADNHNLNLSAGGQFNQQHFDVTADIGKGAEAYSYTGYLPISVLAMVDSDIGQYASGAVNLDMKWKESSASSSTVSLSADTQQMRYSIPSLGLSKPVGQSGKIEAEGTVGKGRVDLSSLMLSDRQIGFTGSLGLNSKTGNILSSQISSLSMGKTQLKGSYYLKSGQHHITLSGPMLDLEPLTKDKSEGGEGKSLLQYLADIPDMVLDVSLNEIHMGEDRGLQDVRLAAQCVDKRCQQFSLNMNSGDVPFSAQIGEVGGKRNFSAATLDFGRILRATGVFDDLRKGALQLSAVYQDDLPNHPMAGRLVLENFNARNVPILTKLLTMATFTGILDTLSGGGLSFQKMVVPFQYDTQKLIIQEGRAVGPSIGITADGALDVAPNTVKIEGTLIPAKLFDTVLTEIPLIGDVYEAITGGEGLVAVNYSMTGSIDEPKIGVNPLSALTPGFLRGFFDIFDRSTAAEVKDAKTAKEAIKAVEQDIQAMEEEAAEKAKEDAVEAEAEAVEDDEAEEAIEVPASTDAPAEESPDSTESEAKPSKSPFKSGKRR